MNHLLSGTALAAALLIAAPVWAQTTTTKTMPSSPAPAATTAPAGAAATPAAPVATTAPHKRMAVHHRVSHHAANRHAANRSHRYHASYRVRPGDIAKQLNAQELGRIGSSTAPATAAAGSYGWGYDQGAGGYGQPSPTQGMPGAWQSSASSHPGPEVWGRPSPTPRMGY